MVSVDLRARPRFLTLAAWLPEALVDWIADFCLQRKATVVVNGHTTEVAELGQAGLPQGSPLSPILFLLDRKSVG